MRRILALLTVLLSLQLLFLYKKMHETQIMVAGPQISHTKNVADIFSEVPQDASMSRKCEAFFSGAWDGAIFDVEQHEHKFDYLNILHTQLKAAFEGQGLTKSAWLLEHFDVAEADPLEIRELYARVWSNSSEIVTLVARAEAELQSILKNSKIMDTQQANSLSVHRVWSQCFLDASVEARCDNSDLKVHEYFLGNMPKITMHDGTKVRPKQAKGCFTQNLKVTASGRGIVVSVGDDHVDLAVRMLRMLRATGNTYPIEIVHMGDLSKASQTRLVDAARDNFVDSLPVKGKRFLEQKFQEVEHEHMSKDYPPQTLFFVDISGALEQRVKRSFVGFGTKVAALMFSQFEEVMLLDADTVPLVSTEMFFSLPGYLETGTYFFRDRRLAWRNKAADIKFWTNLFPSQVESELFGIPQVTNSTRQNRFFGSGDSELMESGVVVINRKQHFAGLLVAMQLYSWGSLVGGKVYGDKEIYWLAQALSGNERYYFNKLEAGNAGELLDSKFSKKILSTHPAHLWDHDQKTVLWINSGFRNCKCSDVLEDDLESLKESGSTQDIFRQKHHMHGLQNWYNMRLNLEAVIVPPALDYYIINSFGAPEFGWEMSSFCNGYFYSAFETVGASKNPKETGTLVEFTKAQKAFYQFLGDLWVA